MEVGYIVKERGPKPISIGDWVKVAIAYPGDKYPGWALEGGLTEDQELTRNFTDPKFEVYFDEKGSPLVRSPYMPVSCGDLKDLSGLMFDSTIKMHASSVGSNLVPVTDLALSPSDQSANSKWTLGPNGNKILISK